MNNMCIGVVAALVGSVLTAAEARLTGSGTVTNDGGSPLKVLMVGNSFSESVLVELPKVAQATSNRLVLVNLMIGGCSLRRHWDNVVRSEDD